MACFFSHTESRVGEEHGRREGVGKKGESVRWLGVKALAIQASHLGFSSWSLELKERIGS